MNWEEIKENSPKSYALCDKWTNSSTLENFYQRGNWDNRKLYDFFDENDIKGFIDYWNRIEGIELMFRIKHGENTYVSTMYDIKRKEIEEKLFIKCFEILENKLNQR